VSTTGRTADRAQRFKRHVQLPQRAGGETSAAKLFPGAWMRPNAGRPSYRGAIALNTFGALFGSVEGLAGRGQQFDAGRVVYVKFGDDLVP